MSVLFWGGQWNDKTDDNDDDSQSEVGIDDESMAVCMFVNIV